MSRALPRGRVTFAFVDVVDSTKTFAAHGEAFVDALAVLQERIARHALAAGGSVVKTEGDGAFLAFESAEAAVTALMGLQEELAQVPRETVPRLRVRAGVHNGEATPVADDYVALAVNIAARVTSTVGAGQVVVSADTKADLPPSVGVCVGDYDLKDVPDPVELWRVCGDETPLRGTPSRRTNVRTPVTGFVGRGAELSELRDLLSAHRIVTVVGAGGLGKTRLVSELVLGIASGIKGGAWLVELAPLTSGDQVATATAHVLGIQASASSAIAAELRRRGEVLLVLDNCEHLLDAVAELVTDLDDGCPELTVLCTSREPVQMPGERVWRLGPFVGQAARIELFTQRAWMSGTTVEDDSMELVDRLCNALDGLPLAIELAATQYSTTSLPELVRIAEEGTGHLGRRGGQPRQRSLDAVLSWSLDRLPGPRRTSLLSLSLFPGHFDADMARALLGAVEASERDALPHLTRACLVDPDGDDFRILDTIRHAARRHLAEQPTLLAAARLGMRTWALDLATQLYRSAQRFEDVSSDQLLALEDALVDAVTEELPGFGKLWELLRAVTFYRGASDRLVALAKQALAGPLPADQDEALVISAAVNLLRGTGELPIPDSRLEEFSEAADRHGVYFAAANLHYILTFHYSERGDAARARRHAEAYLPYAENPVAHPLEKRGMHTLRSEVAHAEHDLEEALRHAEVELAEAKEWHVDLGRETCEVNVACALLELDRADEALPHAAEALRLSPIPGQVRREMFEVLAAVHFARGDVDAALGVIRDAAAELQASGLTAEQIERELVRFREAVDSYRR